MKSLALAAALVAYAAHADATDTRTVVRDALEAQADLPATPPSLPTQASARAVTVHATIAFGQKGAIERTAHSHANSDAANAARRAQAEIANQAAHEAAAAERANDDRHSAAGQARDENSHGRGVNNGNGGNGNGNLNGGLGSPQRHPGLP
jgi:hypothetical protein